VNYRIIDAQQVEDDLSRNQALEAERDAYMQEAEVDRLRAIARGYPATDPRREQFTRSADEVEARARQARKRARRKGRISNVTTAQRKEVQKEFLTRWLTSIESEHAAHTAMNRQRQSQLNDATDPPDDEERASLTTQMAESAGAIDSLEKAWKVATDRLDALDPPQRKRATTKKARSSG
jgi:hypothetical protein